MRVDSMYPADDISSKVESAYINISSVKLKVPTDQFPTSTSGVNKLQESFGNEDQRNLHCEKSVEDHTLAILLSASKASPKLKHIQHLFYLTKNRMIQFLYILKITIAQS